MASSPDVLAEYQDENGNTFQLNEADAKRLGYAKVGAKAAKASQVEAKVVEAEVQSKPAARRTASTK